MPKSSCPTCGQPTDESVHTLSRSLIKLLYTAYRRAGRGAFKPADIHIIRPAGSHMGTAWTHSQRANFQKLQYWDLIEPHINDRNQHMRGWWRVTRQGYDFMRGITQLQQRAVTFNKAIRRHEGAQLYVGQLTGGWQYRGDYARESKPQELCAADKQLLWTEGA